ncbi:MAG: thioredoxin domain-containing protein [Patescibacteria group bacterium]|nr:thioredoxin domain-containing protein [Patescibacteria group bacterium]
MSEKSFFDMSGKQGMLFGLVSGVAIVSVIGFGILLANGQGGFSLGSKNAPGANANVAAAPTPTPTPTPTPSAGDDFSKVPKVTASDHVRGDNNAAVTLIEYSDYQCPYCSQLEPTMEKILADYKGKVRIVYRNFPLTTIHPYAQGAAEASECAAEQGKFWEMHDQLFSNQTALDETSLKSYAAKIGLNTSQFDSCLTSHKYASQISQSASDAQASGITGTPGVWVGNQLIKGAYPYDTFKQLIDSLLK